MCTLCDKALIKELNMIFGNRLDTRIVDVIQGRGHSLKTKCPAMKELEELTPMGSEFWEDPKRCSTMVKDSRSSIHRLLVKTVGERNDALAELELVKTELANLKRTGCMPAVPPTGGWKTNLSTEDAKAVIADLVSFEERQAEQRHEIGDVLMGKKPELND